MRNLQLHSAKLRLSLISIFIEKLPFKNKFIASFCFIGIPSYIVFCLHLYLKKKILGVPIIELISVFIAFNWTWLGPYLIWKYEKWEMFSLKKALSKIIEADQLDELFKKYEKPLEKTDNYIIIIWIVLVLFAFYESRPYVLKLGFYSERDTFYLLSYIYIEFLSYLTALGFVGILRTYKIIYALYKSININLCCYHADEINGLSSIIRFTKKTTLFFASGSLFIPILNVVTRLCLSTISIYALIGLFSISIIFNYIVPNYLIWKKAKRKKIKTLQTICNKYLAPLSTLNNKEKDYPNYLYYRNLFNDIKASSINPFKIKYLSPVIIYGVMPIVANFFQVVLTIYFSPPK